MLPSLSPFKRRTIRRARFLTFVPKPSHVNAAGPRTCDGHATGTATKTVAVEEPLASEEPAEPCLVVTKGLNVGTRGVHATFTFSVNNPTDQAVALTSAGIRVEGTRQLTIGHPAVILGPGETYVFTATAKLQKGQHTAHIELVGPDGLDVSFADGAMPSRSFTL